LLQSHNNFYITRTDGFNSVTVQVHVSFPGVDSLKRSFPWTLLKSTHVIKTSLGIALDNIFEKKNFKSCH